MSTPPSPRVHKGSKRKSVLGAARKIGGASRKIARPFKAVGRAVRGKSHGRSGGHPSDDCEIDSSEYGALIEGDEEELDESSSEETEIVVRSRSDSNVAGASSTRRSSIVNLADGPGGALMGVDPEWPVHSMEKMMRQALMICSAYMIGARRPEFLSQVGRATEYAGTAWGTCVAILILAYIQKNYPYLSATNQFVRRPSLVQPEEEFLVEEQPLLMQSSRSRSKSKSKSKKKRSSSVDDEMKPADFEQPAITASRSIEESVTAEKELPHPSLQQFYICDGYTSERVFPNDSSPTHISTEWFEMDMLVMIRTPDTDDPSQPRGSASNDNVADYLRGKQRRFEFQYQMKLKKVPEGKHVYFACELDTPIKMGLIQKAFVGAAMAFMKKTNPTFHYSITGSKERPADGSYEMPHMSFTAEGSLDRLVVTKPGETLPKLGEAIFEDPESIKARKKGVPFDWNTEDTYTMALWSAYVDFLEWRVMNLPGIRPFSLNSVLGNQSIKLTLYLIEAERGNDKHYAKDITNLVNLELSNSEHAACGPVAKVWSAAQAAGTTKVRRERALSPPSDIETEDVEDEVSVSAVSQATSQVSMGQSQHSHSHSRHQRTALRSIPRETSDTPVDVTFPKTVEEFHGEDLEEVDTNVEAAAELGEGIYLRSGDSVVLRELVDVDGEGEANDSRQPCSVSNGGGFAVLQDQDINIVIRKVSRSKRNRLIKSGDTVAFKMIQKRGGQTEIRYLTIHRGWWLKWVSTPPTKNGSFTIYNHEPEFEEKEGKEIRPGEGQSEFLTLGGSFTLRHKRWSSYYVGVAADPSPTYGGRMLGLYNPKSKNARGHVDEQYHSDEGDIPELEGDPVVDNKSKGVWMKPLILSPQEHSNLLPAIGSLSPVRSKLSITATETEVETAAGDAESPPADKPHELIFSNEHSLADVPAWIEMMNRTERIRQLTYAVRVSHRVPSKPSDEGKMDEEIDQSENMESDESNRSFVKLRTGRELAKIMAIGQNTRASLSSPTSIRAPARTSSLRHSEGAREGLLSLSPGLDSSQRADVPMHLSLDPLGRDADSSESDSIVSHDKVSVLSYNVDDEEASHDERESEIDESSVMDVESEPGREKKRHGAVRKGKAIIGKVAKTAKSATVKTVTGTSKLAAKTVVGTGKLTAKTVVGTGKLTGKVALGTGKIAVKHSKMIATKSVKAAKGTVNVGKSITMSAGKAVVGPISRKSKKPPKTEPKKRQENQAAGVHVEVSKTMKKIERIEAKSARPPAFLAAELCAPEQSCRTASRVLTRMSNVQFQSPAWRTFNEALTSQVNTDTDQDRWFLQGNSVQLGVTPLPSDRSRGALVHESLVARGLWESHWREEWCGMYESCVSFYAPMTKAPCLELSYIDITNVRPLDANSDTCPLPGFPILVLETAWLCHYVAFSDEEARDTFGEKVEVAIEKHIRKAEESASIQESDLRKARFWQGFQSLSESSLSSVTGKWAKVSSGQKPRERAILNGRRMAFDSLGSALAKMSNGFMFVEDLLSRALSFSLESLEKDPDSFVEFLDLTSQLRLLPLEEIDLSSRHAFCLFANIYHCLFQQALLLSVNGPLDKKSIGQFMRTSCYEIGGDVFSLAELYCCVLRGKMSKPKDAKPPYIEAPRKSKFYRHYALHFTDPRVNFVLNTGDIACPQAVPILRASDIEHQLNKAASVFLKQELEIDLRRRLVILPKVCEVYKSDFGTDSMSCLRFCLNGLDEATASTIRVMLMDESNLVIRYQHTAESYHACLKLQKDPAGVQLNQVLREIYDD